ncbi:MAG: metal-dependent transcriptional regulator [Candidatus Izemoplasmatales bacterium]|nr:metal-dependent transcriptional regulator [Candidatus Izemoplasmatales bacterium]
MRHKADLSESMEDYLEAIIMLGGENVRSVDIANHLNVSRASVNKAINYLIEEALVHKKPYGDISLTEAGKKVSKAVFHKHKVIKRFLVEICGIDEEIAEKEACGIEHNISHQTAERIERLLVQKDKTEIEAG